MSAGASGEPARLRRSRRESVTGHPAVLNAVVGVEIAAGGPEEIVRQLQRIERDLGRAPSPRFGPRAIDLDPLLIAGSPVVSQDADVVVPHRRLAERRFGRAPLAELASDEIDPRTGRTIGELSGLVTDQPATVVEDAEWWKTASS